jgi:hypothetical protein
MQLALVSDCEDCIMKSGLMARRVAAVIGGGAVVAMVGFTASCAKEEQKAPETTTTTTTTTTVAPTEKSINPTGGNLFTPPVKAPPAPTATPGDH